MSKSYEESVWDLRSVFATIVTLSERRWLSCARRSSSWHQTLQIYCYILHTVVYWGRRTYETNTLHATTASLFIYILYWTVLSTLIYTYCTMLGLLDRVWSPLVPCISTEDTVWIGNSFITIPITLNYNHSQLSLTLLRVCTIIILTRS
jgi:hypothetical protein